MKEILTSTAEPAAIVALIIGNLLGVAISTRFLGRKTGDFAAALLVAFGVDWLLWVGLRVVIYLVYGL